MAASPNWAMIRTMTIQLADPMRNWVVPVQAIFERDLRMGKSGIKDLRVMRMMPLPLNR